jgi:glycosyltransferase involved in cell wall biosynthesis
LNILLVTARYPWPPRRGDQLRTGQMLELLAPDHRVTLLTPVPGGGGPPPPAAVTVETYGAPGAGSGARGSARAACGGLARAAACGLPLQSGLFFSPDLRRQLHRLAPRADLVVLQLVRLALHRDDLGATPLLVDLIDDLALNFARRAAVDRLWLRPALALEARLLSRAQRRLARQAAGMLVVCERDRQELARRLPAALAGRVRTAGLAVEPGPGPAGEAPHTGPPRLVFTGNLGYFVNADAISWWLREVWPALAARRPDLRLVVAGARPSPKVRRAVAGAGGSGAVALVESAPDLRQVLAGATAALAPLRSGSGVPVKVLEAWSAGVPVVASPWAAAGTTGVAGEDLLVAESPRQWVAAVSDLIQDPAAQRRLASNGRRRLVADYSRQRVKDQLLAAVAAAVPT